MSHKTIILKRKYIIIAWQKKTKKTIDEMIKYNSTMPFAVGAF